MAERKPRKVKRIPPGILRANLSSTAKLVWAFRYSRSDEWSLNDDSQGYIGKALGLNGRPPAAADLFH